MVYAVGKFLCWIISVIFFPMKVEGLENIPRRGGFIIAGNHASYLDPVILGVACPRVLNYLARNSLFRHFLFRWILLHVNVIPLKRHSADFSALKEALRRLEKGEGFLLFPEGTRRSAGQDMGKGLAGVGFLARKCQAPVIPAYIKDSDKALPRGSKFIRRSPVTVVFGTLVLPSEGRDVSDEDMTSEVMKHIASLRDSIKV